MKAIGLLLGTWVLIGCALVYSAVHRNHDEPEDKAVEQSAQSQAPKPWSPRELPPLETGSMENQQTDSDVIQTSITTAPALLGGRLVLGQAGAPAGAPALGTAQPLPAPRIVSLWEDGQNEPTTGDHITNPIPKAPVKVRVDVSDKREGVLDLYVDQKRVDSQAFTGTASVVFTLSYLDRGKHSFAAKYRKEGLPDSVLSAAVETEVTFPRPPILVAVYDRTSEPSQPSTSPIPIKTPFFTLSVSGTLKDDVVVALADNEEIGRATATGSPFSFATNKGLAERRYIVSAKIIRGGDASVPASGQLISYAPAPSTIQSQPQVTEIYNGPYASPQAPPTGTDKVKVYDTYLRLRGLGAVIGRMEFFLDKITLPFTSVEITRAGEWDVTLALPSLSDDHDHDLKFRTIGQDGPGAEVTLPFTVVTNPPLLSAPTIEKINDKPSGVTPLRVSTPTLTVAGTGGLQPAKVLVYREGSGDPLGVSDTLSTDVWKLTTKVPLAPGQYRIRARQARGSRVGPESDPFLVVIRTKGPRVVGLIPPNFGTAAGAEVLTIQFDPDSPLDPDTARDSTNYVLTPSGGTGQFTRGLPSLTIKMKEYNPSNNSVSLSSDQLKPDIYQLTVVGAVTTTSTGPIKAGAVTTTSTGPIKDIYGNPLEGTNGPGTDYVVVIGKPASSEETLPSESRGITGQTGPYVKYKEYTEPHEFPDGFNPADHVETRVARLYYYRDAHRVAQIINREAKSYNRAAVDVRRRLADKARDEANKATDERRMQERKAVQAAHEAREAERTLRQEQAALAQIRQQASSAAAQGTATNQQVLRARDDLAAQQRAVEVAQTDADASERNYKDATAGAATNPTDPQLRDQVLRAETQLAGARGRLKDAQAASKAGEKQLSDLTLALNNATKTAADDAQAQTQAEQRVQAALANLQAKRNTEVAENEKALQATAKEDRFREEQFRREVAAAHEDPDTYAPGKPESYDAVEQTSVSVIGEGLIQLRGPLRGINKIRIMINDMDSPVGQVRVAVHTVQVNGEHGDRMEKVVERMDRYLNHARFLSAQSAQMLRRAVVHVASLKAEQAAYLCPTDGQAARDEKYLYAFFGRDFTNELRALDSEFLNTGNKILSLHSMDTTSLAAALFLLALANNETRREILEEFQRLITSDLPNAELEFFEEGGYYKDCHKFRLMGGNAHFRSLLGFFQSDTLGQDTMSPIQREFIRLAQIFKSRLVTELEYNQRVMERALIEERLGNYLAELKQARDKEQKAKQAFEEAQQARDTQQGTVLQATQTIESTASTILADIATVENQTKNYSTLFEEAVDSVLEPWRRDLERITAKLLSQGNRKLAESLISLFQNARRSVLEQRRNNKPVPERLLESSDSLLEGLADELRKLKAPVDQLKDAPLLGVSRFRDRTVSFKIDAKTKRLEFIDVSEAEFVTKELGIAVSQADEIRQRFDRFQLDESRKNQLALADRLLSNVRKLYPNEALDNLEKLRDVFRIYGDLFSHILRKANAILDQLHGLISTLIRQDGDIQRAYSQWLVLKPELLKYAGKDLRAIAEQLTASVDAGFRKLLEANLRQQIASQQLNRARQPIDHKKLLDMLIDEVEDKYIELLEGTRAHTANVDDYVKRIATALDDDLNTQFYNPAFREVRRAAETFWDVNLGKIETTTILTNNRAFAKVTPEATMEFDLPKRDILITEAMKGAKAMVEEYGALVQDPAFLSLVKLRSGQPPSSPAQGAAGGLAQVRNVLPGLPSQTDEQNLSQGGPGRREFGAAFEALIPDPAIYKFETGTGFEIRPVISPDGQSVVFHFNYMYTTDVREPVRADEKHLGRVKRHFVDTDVQLGNYELREVSRYVVALKASRTSKGVPLFEDIPGLGILFRPLPSAESSLQENIILAQSTIFPTLFDLMGLRWAPPVAELDPLRTINEEFIARSRNRDLRNHVFDYTSSKVDEFLRIPQAERRPDLYRSQETIPYIHPNGYSGPGLNLRDSRLEEGYDPRRVYPPSQAIPRESPEGRIYPPQPAPGFAPPGPPLVAPGIGPGRGIPEMRPSPRPEAPSSELQEGYRSSPAYPSGPRSSDWRRGGDPNPKATKPPGPEAGPDLGGYPPGRPTPDFLPSQNGPPAGRQSQPANPEGRSSPSVPPYREPDNRGVPPPPAEGGPPAGQNPWSSSQLPAEDPVVVPASHATTQEETKPKKRSIFSWFRKSDG